MKLSKTQIVKTEILQEMDYEFNSSYLYEKHQGFWIFRLTNIIKRFQLTSHTIPIMALCVSILFLLWLTNFGEFWLQGDWKAALPLFSIYIGDSEACRRNWGNRHCVCLLSPGIIVHCDFRTDWARRTYRKYSLHRHTPLTANRPFLLSFGISRGYRKSGLLNYTRSKHF